MNEENIEPIRLLFVDDEVNILKALKRLFRGSEYSVNTAESGREALALLEQQAFDLIISDMRMPQMDGAEFLTQAASKWPETVRILLTGYADLESTVAAINQGHIYCYCSKPWEDNELKILVNNAVEQKRLREERRRLLEIVQRQNAELKDLNTHLEDKVELRTEQLRSSLHKLDQAHGALKKQYHDSIKTFVKIIEMRPGIKSGHSMYLAETARDLAQIMGMQADETRDVMYAGLLSQIGKMCLPDDLLNKPIHKLSGNEKKQFFLHGQEGWNLLRGISQLNNSAEMILHQFEAFDGNGEPNSLQQDEIPLGSRILAVVRDYLCYLDGQMTGTNMTVEQVKKQLIRLANKNYDPQVVEAFLGLLSASCEADERPVIEVSWTQLQPGMEVAEIIIDEVLFLKDTILTAKNIDNLLELRKHQKNLLIKIRI